MGAGKNNNLDRPQLSLCVSLIENGVNPEALAVSHGTIRLEQQLMLQRRARLRN